MTYAHIPPIDCSQFEAQLGDFLEGVVSDEQRALMDAHRAGCVKCATLVADLDAIVAGASALPALKPSHDLWPGIEARINTPVVSLDGRAARAIVPRMYSVRTFAAAAIVLVTISSGVTWMLAHNRETTSPVSGAPTVATTPAQTVSPAAPASTPANGGNTPAVAAASNAAPATGAPARSIETSSTGGARARLASRGNDDVSLIYEREIRAMRRVVDERLGDLDSTTVAEVERNLNIIDKAIEDSRRALARDPRSRFLSTQLDRALENKLSIMRRVALL